MELKKVGIICSNKVSDGLMMMVASHRLMSEGSSVVTFHNRLHELAKWFGDHKFAERPESASLLDLFSDYDLVILQYDNSPYAKEVVSKLANRKSPKLSIFYPTYSKYAHAPLTPWDRVFNKNYPMVENISLAIASILQLRDHSKNNGIFPPPNLEHRKHKRRVAILPSKSIHKKYETIANEVKKLGFDPFLIESENLAYGAKIIYESGYFIGPESDLCHLASNLQIPTLVVSGNKKPLSLWKPGWLRSSFITPPPFIPKIVERFIFTPRVTSAFKKLVAKDKIYL